MAKIDSSALLQAAYSKMTLDQLITTRAGLVDQLAVLDQLIKDRSPEVPSDD